MLGSMSGTRAISTTSRREQPSGFLFLQGKAPKEIHAILTETLACFLPGRAKDLSAPLYCEWSFVELQLLVIIAATMLLFICFCFPYKFIKGECIVF